MSSSSSELVPRFAATALGSFAIGAVLSWWLIKKNEKKKEIMAESWKQLENEQVDEELMKEQLTRNISMLGEEAVEKMRKSFVIVVGLGGVGSHAAHHLVRAGIEHLRLIDFDQVTLSSLNRNSLATREDVGIPKVVSLKNHLLKILPHAKIETVYEVFNGEFADRLLEGNPDFVLDCIDNISTKTQLVQYCYEKKIPIVVASGSATKLDPSRVRVADIHETKVDPLSRQLRRRLRQLGITEGVPVVYSTETPKVELLPLDEEVKKDIESYKTMKDFRIRILPVFGTVPAAFGTLIASYVCNQLAGRDTHILGSSLSDKRYKNTLKNLKEREKEIYKNNPNNVNLNLSDIAYIVEEIWNGRSAISGAINGNKLYLTRWDKTKQPTKDNLILLTKDEMLQHEQLESLDSYDSKFRDRVEKKFEKERWIQQQLEDL